MGQYTHMGQNILITPQKEQPAHYHHNLSFTYAVEPLVAPIFVSSTLLCMVMPAVLSFFPPPQIKTEKSGLVTRDYVRRNFKKGPDWTGGRHIA